MSTKSSSWIQPSVKDGRRVYETVPWVSLFFEAVTTVTGDHGVCPNMQYVPCRLASSPFVTGVGATDEYNMRGASFMAEDSATGMIPTYQQSAVASFKSRSKAMKQCTTRRAQAFLTLQQMACNIGLLLVEFPTRLAEHRRDAHHCRNCQPSQRCAHVHEQDLSRTRQSVSIRTQSV